MLKKRTFHYFITVKTIPASALISLALAACAALAGCLAVPVFVVGATLAQPPQPAAPAAAQAPASAPAQPSAQREGVLSAQREGPAPAAAQAAEVSAPEVGKKMSMSAQVLRKIISENAQYADRQGQFPWGVPRGDYVLVTSSESHTIHHLQWTDKAGRHNMRTYHSRNAKVRFSCTTTQELKKRMPPWAQLMLPKQEQLLVLGEELGGRGNAQYYFLRNEFPYLRRVYYRYRSNFLPQDFVVWLVKENAYKRPEVVAFIGRLSVQDRPHYFMQGAYHRHGRWEDAGCHDITCFCNYPEEKIAYTLETSGEISNSFPQLCADLAGEAELFLCALSRQDITYYRFNDDSTTHLEVFACITKKTGEIYMRHRGKYISPADELARFAMGLKYDDPAKPPFTPRSFKTTIGPGGHITFGYEKEQPSEADSLSKHPFISSVGIGLSGFKPGTVVKVSRLFIRRLPAGFKPQWILKLEVEAEQGKKTYYYRFTGKGRFLEQIDLTPEGYLVAFCGYGVYDDQRLSPFYGTSFTRFSGAKGYFVGQWTESGKVHRVRVLLALLPLDGQLIFSAHFNNDGRWLLRVKTNSAFYRTVYFEFSPQRHLRRYWAEVAQWSEAGAKAVQEAAEEAEAVEKARQEARQRVSKEFAAAEECVWEEGAASEDYRQIVLSWAKDLWKKNKDICALEELIQIGMQAVGTIVLQDPKKVNSRLVSISVNGQMHKFIEQRKKERKAEEIVRAPLMVGPVRIEGLGEISEEDRQDLEGAGMFLPDEPARRGEFVDEETPELEIYLAVEEKEVEVEGEGPAPKSALKQGSPERRELINKVRVYLRDHFAAVSTTDEVRPLAIQHREICVRPEKFAKLAGIDPKLARQLPKVVAEIKSIQAPGEPVRYYSWPKEKS